MTRTLAQSVAAAVFDAIESAHLHSGAISLSTVESAVEAAIAEHKRDIEKDHPSVVAVAAATISCGDLIKSNWHTYTVGPVYSLDTHTFVSQTS